MLYVLAGDPGSGKTLKVLPWMQQAVAAGRPVYTNIELTELCPFRDKVGLIGTPEWPVAYEDDERCEMERRLRKPLPQFFWEYTLDGSLVVIDEGDLYFDSGNFGEMKKQTKIFHKQHRKLQYDVVYIVQRISNLYKRIRDMAGAYFLAEHNYRTTRMFGAIEAMAGREAALNLSKFFYWEFGSPDFAPRSLRGVGQFTYREASRFFGWYRTEQMLGDCSRILRPDWESRDVNAEPENARRSKGRRSSIEWSDEPRGLDGPAVAV